MIVFIVFQTPIPAATTYGASNNDQLVIVHIICAAELQRITIENCFSMVIETQLETSNRPGRGRFEAFHCSSLQLSLIKWEKLMVELASMVMNITGMQWIQCKHTRIKHLMVSKILILHENRFNWFEMICHAQWNIILAQTEIIMSQRKFLMFP